MTNEEAIKEISVHKKHWERLRREEICSQVEGTVIIDAFDMAIKALEQEPCEDAISRQRVKSEYADWYGYGYQDNWFYKYLNTIPSVNPQEPKTEWIPISERLPEIHRDVLLELRSGEILTGFRSETESYFYIIGGYVEPENVIAWMPLPEPYKAESEDK